MSEALLLDRWRAEREAAYLARVAAAAERDPAKARLFETLAAEGEGQAAILARGLSPLPDFTPSTRVRTVERLVRLFGPRHMRMVLAAMKMRGLSVYSSPYSAAHHPMPATVAEVGGRHRGGAGGTLRAAVFGVNDGLVSNTCLILGVAGSAAGNEVILISGFAGMLAGAFSMAAGEYVSMQSQKEMFEYQIGLERAEIAAYPKEEAEELALIYAARGIDIDDARAMARKLIAQPEVALDVLAREELGLNPDDLGSPWGAAIYSFLSFIAGAILPLLPFLLSFSGNAVLFASLLSGIALFAVGAMLSLFSGRSALLGGLRMLLIGGLAAAATYGIGLLFGVGLA